MRRTALVTGITGQDGSYLAELLLSKGYAVHGLIRRTSTVTTSRVQHLCESAGSDEAVTLHYGDLTDGTSLLRVLDAVEPDEVYNLGAQSHVRISFDCPVDTADIGALGTIRLLEGIRHLQDRLGREVRFYQASSSEMFGKVHETPQRETTPFHPRSPYAVAKVYSHWAVVNYREAYGLHASAGILFNHESPRRGEEFVTRKITRAVGRIAHGLQDTLYLGNLDARRDWGFAGDYVDAMWRMLQQDEPDDYVVATGETYSVHEFLEAAFSSVDLDYRDYVKIDPRFCRPAEVDLLLGDATKARDVLDWEPRVGFAELVHMMVEHDREVASREKALLQAGFASGQQMLRAA